MVSKEYWANLSDEEKSKVIGKFCEINLLGPDFSYEKARDFSETLKKKYEEVGISNPKNSWDNPVLVLKLVDPILANVIISWMYTKVEVSDGSKISVPFMGYNLVELGFDKKAYTEFSFEERDILNRAIEILKNKV